jgi:hypothetical protein
MMHTTRVQEDNEKHTTEQGSSTKLKIKNCGNTKENRNYLFCNVYKTETALEDDIKI